MILRIIAVKKNKCATIYATEKGRQMTEQELFNCALEAHEEDYIVREANIDDFQYIVINDTEYYYPWLCSLVANYNFSEKEFEDLWHFISGDD